MNKKLILATVILNTCFASAQAHVRFEQSEAPAGQYHVAGLLIPHGCGDSPTNKITVSIPEGVTQVIPRAQQGWQLERTMRKLKQPITIRGEKVTETVSKVSWAQGKLPSFAFQRFDISMKLPNGSDDTLRFPVTQICQEGQAFWDNIPSKAGEKVDHPAPYLKLTPGHKAKGHH